MTPFFVVDRPMSLNILKTSFVNHPDLTFGLMTHAFVSDKFLRLFADFPGDNSGNCWLQSEDTCNPLQCSQGILCPLASQMGKQIIRMCDYGIFEKGSRELSYKKLYAIYERAKADYGVMQDILGDSTSTIKSARQALSEYGKEHREFKLVLVTQGTSIDEYLRCYEKLKKMGGEYIAVGGLLRRRERTARYMNVGSEVDMLNIIEAIRRRFDPEWLFVLGAYHANRHRLFTKLDVFGSDYKGWIFQYKHRRQIIENFHQELSKIESGHIRTNLLQQVKGKRNRLARLEKQKRLFYINLKNTSKENRVLKAASRERLKSIQEQLFDTDISLLQIRTAYISKNGVPENYKNALSELISVTRLSDQKIRVREVHHYLEEKIYPQCYISELGKYTKENTVLTDCKAQISLNENRLENRVALVIGCGKAKIWDKRPNAGSVAAKDAYTGALFRLCRRYAEQFYPDRWFILSANYGLLNPDTLITNYNISFTDSVEKGISQSQLRVQCSSKLYRYNKIISLGGKAYNLHLAEALGARQKLEAPLASLRLFDRMRWLKSRVAYEITK